jgi:hypothetical protein
MEEPILLRSQKNAVFETLLRNQLDPSEFAWSTAPHTEVLVHRPSGYQFRLVAAKDLDGSVLYRLAYSPGQARSEETTSVDPGDWNGLSRLFEKWAACLAREVLVPDLWATLSPAPPLATAATSPADNSPFTREEQLRLSLKLEDLKKYVKESAALNEDQLSHVDREFEYLGAAAERMGRVDWKNVLAGLLVSLVIDRVANPQIVKLAWTLVGGLLGAR